LHALILVSAGPTDPVLSAVLEGDVDEGKLSNPEMVALTICDGRASSTLTPHPASPAMSLLEWRTRCLREVTASTTASLEAGVVQKFF
jgi:hypothetical protein